MSGGTAGLALVAFLAAAPAVETVRAQGLGDAAARGHQERLEKAREGKPAVPAYTNEALEGSGEEGGQETKATEDAGRESSGVSADSAPEAENVGAEVHWRRQADDYRRAIANAEKVLAEAEARSAQLLQDRDPLSGLFDPNRLQALEAQRAQARAETAAARQSLAESRQALADLEEEARRKSVPPGWLRER